MYERRAGDAAATLWLACMEVGHIGISLSSSEQSAGLTLSTLAPKARLHTSACVSQFTRQPRSSESRYCSADRFWHCSSSSPTKTLCSDLDLARPLGMSFFGPGCPAKPTLHVCPPLSTTTRVSVLPMAPSEGRYRSRRATPQCTPSKQSYS